MMAMASSCPGSQSSHTGVREVSDIREITDERNAELANPKLVSSPFICLNRPQSMTLHCIHASDPTAPMRKASLSRLISACQGEWVMGCQHDAVLLVREAAIGQYSIPRACRSHLPGIGPRCVSAVLNGAVLMRTCCEVSAAGWAASVASFSISFTASATDYHRMNQLREWGKTTCLS